MMNLRRVHWMLVTLGVCLAAQGSARASFTTDLGSISTPSSGLTTLTYNLSFNPDDFGTPGSSQLMSGNYVTLYDFSTSLLPTSTVVVPSGISYAISGTGFTSPNSPSSPPVDSPLINNITFTYTGPTLVAATSFRVSITLPGTFTLGSQFGTYQGLAAYNTTSFVGTSGSYFVPLASVPEPSSLALCGIASLIGLGYAQARARRRLPA